ncbi:hypothetical protein ACSZNB_01475 [Aeromonas hydrophila]
MTTALTGLTWEQFKLLHAVVTRAADTCPATSDECKELRVLQELVWCHIQAPAPEPAPRPVPKAPVVFEYHDIEMNVFIIDGKPFVPKQWKGLRWAFCVLASHQMKEEPPEALRAFRGKASSKASINALRRAAEEIEALSPQLSTAIRNIKHRRGRSVYVGPDNLVACVSTGLGIHVV